MNLALTLLFVLAAPAHALAGTTWHVDDDNCPGPGDGTAGNPFCHVQDGIDAAGAGDIVLVRPGVYVENIDFLGKAIVVRSDGDGNPATHDPTPVTTVIDGNAAGSVVTMTSGEGPSSVLEGFTI